VAKERPRVTRCASVGELVVERTLPKS
jgi:hypothetical protein